MVWIWYQWKTSGLLASKSFLRDLLSVNLTLQKFWKNSLPFRKYLQSWRERLVGFYSIAGVCDEDALSKLNIPKWFSRLAVKYIPNNTTSTFHLMRSVNINWLQIDNKAVLNYVPIDTQVHMNCQLKYWRTGYLQTAVEVKQKTSHFLRNWYRAMKSGPA